MARLTAKAAGKFKEILAEQDYKDAAIRLGRRPVEPDSFEHYIDFIPESKVNMLEDIVNVTNGVLVVIRRSDESSVNDLTIDYMDSPEGFIFYSGK